MTPIDTTGLTWETLPTVYPLGLDWATIPLRFRYIAMDQSEIWFAYVNKPLLGRRVWDISVIADYENDVLTLDSYPMGSTPSYSRCYVHSLSERPTR